MARVLVVDDEPDVCRLLTDALSAEGHGVLVARDGAEALFLARLWRPDVILLDLMMPTMNGWQFAERYRAEPELCAPVIVMTAAGAALSRIVAGLAAWSDAIEVVLSKPLDVDHVLGLVAYYSRVNRLLDTAS